MHDGSLKKIGAIVPGDVVRGRDGINTVVQVFEIDLPKGQPLYRFNRDGRFFITKDHPVLTTQGWKAVDCEASMELHKDADGKPTLELGKLRTGRHTMVKEFSEERLSSIESIQIKKMQIVFNLQVTGDATFIVDGWVVHNKKIICAELQRRGLMPMDERMWSLRGTLCFCSPTTLAGYHAWAIPVAKRVREGRGLKFWTFWSRHRARELGFRLGLREKPDYIGKMIRLISEPPCFLIGCAIKLAGYVPDWRSIYNSKYPEL